jgi:5-(carboxyamino)imidazole ribonucleotide mutase
MSCRAIVLLAFTEADLEALVPTGEVLKSFGIVAERVLLGVASGETPDFTKFAAQAASSGVPIVISAIRDTAWARALAGCLTAPMIRVPVPQDGSPAAALRALTEGAGSAAGNAAEAVSRGSFATVALGEAGAKNAALLAVSILALTDDRLREAWEAFRDQQTQAVLSQPPPSG